MGANNSNDPPKGKDMPARIAARSVGYLPQHRFYQQTNINSACGAKSFVIRGSR